MQDFYAIDSDFNKLRGEVRPNAKAAKSTALPAIVEELQNSIKQSVSDAEQSFKRRATEECRLYLFAAKSNQVVMLGMIDDIPDLAISVDKRTALRETCKALGTTLTKMLLQAKTQAAAAVAEKERKHRTREVNNETLSPGSPTAIGQTREISRNTPLRDSKKRAQGDADSPVLTEMSPKRQRADATASPSVTTTNHANMSTGTTTTTTSALTTSPLPSSPIYRLVHALDVGHESRDPDVDGMAKKLDLVQPQRTTPKSSPKKFRALNPQPKPRPRSQLFVAPPDFTAQILADSPPRTATITPGSLLLDASTSNAVESKQADTDRSGPES